MKRLVIVLIALIMGLGSTAFAASTSDGCLVDGIEVSASECDSIADADWEGLSSEQQLEVMNTGLDGPTLDQYVIDYRSGYRIDEDEPSWNCQTMGNRICGPIPELPHTL
jgi:hypothetical protein